MSEEPGELDAADIDFDKWQPPAGFAAESVDDAPNEADVFDLDADDDDDEEFDDA